jgi:uncharacterized protein (TIGR02271 family)
LQRENAAYVMTQRSVSPDGRTAMNVQQVRLVRHHHAALWQYRVHEQILPSLRRAGFDVRGTDIVLQHTGYQLIRRKRLTPSLPGAGPSGTMFAEPLICVTGAGAGPASAGVPVTGKQCCGGATVGNTQRTTVVGVFENRQQAQQAVNELRRLGFREDQIGVAAREGHVEGGHDVAGKGSHVAAGAATGVAVGAGAGALWGLGILAGVMPVIGPAIAGGTLGVLLSSAAAGAAVAGLAGALVGLGIPEEEAKYYEGEFKAGRTIVTVNAGGRYDEAAALLRRYGAYDMHTRGEARTIAATAQAAGASVSGAGAGTRTEAGKTVRLHEEELRVQKQPVEAGEVRVRKEVHTEHRSMEVPVRKEEVVIERHPVAGRPASAADIRAGEEVRIPVREEQVHVEKTPVVKEEVTVGKRQVQETEQVSGTVRKEEVRVEKSGDVDVRDHTKDKRKK